MKFSSKESSKCDQSRRKLQIWSHLLKKSLMPKLLFLCSIFSQRKYGDFAGFSQFSKNLFTFTNEILYRKLHFLYSLLVKLGVNVRKFRTKKNYSNFYYALRKNKFCIQNGKKRYRDLLYTVYFFPPFSKV